MLVHCAQGRSRSGTVACVYVACTECSGDVQGALGLVQQRRAMVAPNDGFMQQMQRWQAQGTLHAWARELAAMHVE